MRKDMDITTRISDNVIIVEIAGDIDGKTAPKAQEQVLPLCKPGSRLMLDLHKVEYMSSAGLRFILTVYRQISSVNGRLVLVGLSDDLQDTMSATGFLSRFTTAETLAQGIAALH